jgi:hypothetical protein
MEGFESTVSSFEIEMTEIFTTSEGVIVAENRDGIYDPYCLVSDGVVSVPTIGGEWIPCMKLNSNDE